MNTISKKRGRPKSEKTLEKERIDSLLSNPPKYINPLTDNEKIWLKTFLESTEKAKNTILEGYSPFLSHSLIYELASLDDESLHGHEATILEKFNLWKQKEIRSMKRGAKETKSIAESKAKDLWGKNEKLVARIQSKSISLHGAASNIVDHWDRKGIKGKCPSVKTISNWYKRVYS